MSNCKDGKVCKMCPFKRDALPGWLGSYSGPEDFIRTHYAHDVPNPCHMTVDYEREDWKESLDDARPCIGQMQMYRNAYKLPRTWKIPADVGENPDVFRTTAEFIAHHKVGK